MRLAVRYWFFQSFVDGRHSLAPAQQPDHERARLRPESTALVIPIQCPHNQAVRQGQRLEGVAGVQVKAQGQAALGLQDSFLIV